MKKVIYLFMALLAFNACNETEVPSDALRANVEFQSFTPEYETILKGKIKRPKNTPSNIESIKIDMTHAQGNVGDLFTIDDNSNGNFRLENVFVGDNKLVGFAQCKAKTTPSCGMYFNNKDMIETYKKMQVWSNFECNEVVNVKYKNNKPVLLNWEATHGSLIIHISFEQDELRADYVQFNSVKKGVNYNPMKECTFMYNCKDAVDNKQIDLAIKVTGIDKEITTINLPEAERNKLKVRAGYIRIVKVKIKERVLKTGVSFDMEFPDFKEEDFKINL